MKILLSLLLLVHASLCQAAPPNIVIILADDLGAEALGCYGGARFLGKANAELGPVKTPNLDALARTGIQFNQAYATPVCSPSRAQLLTGKYNFRSGFTDIAGRNGAARALDAKAHPTIPVLLKAAGYATAAVGKWHLAPLGKSEKLPESAGQDSDYAHVKECGFERQFVFPGPHLREYGEPVAGRYTPDIMDAWTGRFLEENRGKPFFLYYASPLPHFPYWPTPLNPDGPRGDPNDKMEALYGDMRNFPYLIEYLDIQVGRIVKKLEELGVRENTLLLFAGDNGTPPWLVTELKDGRKVPFGKGTLKDTGSWVPFIVNWPGIVNPAVHDGLVDFSDILPTCLEVAGVTPPGGLDGISFAPVLRGKPGITREWVHSLYVDKYFVRDARWKLRENGELYDVSGTPFVEKLVTTEDEPAREARTRLQAVLDRLHPR